MNPEGRSLLDHHDHDRDHAHAHAHDHELHSSNSLFSSISGRDKWRKLPRHSILLPLYSINLIPSLFDFILFTLRHCLPSIPIHIHQLQQCHNLRK
jgi:hypothetical protein